MFPSNTEITSVTYLNTLHPFVFGGTMDSMAFVALYQFDDDNPDA